MSSAAAQAAQNLKKEREKERKRTRDRPVTLTLKDKPAPPIIDDDGSWTGRVASWFIENGVEQGLTLEPMPGRVLRETEKAVLFRQENDPREVWIPKSVIEEVTPRNE